MKRYLLVIGLVLIFLVVLIYTSRSKNRPPIERREVLSGQESSVGQEIDNEAIDLDAELKALEKEIDSINENDLNWED